VLAESIGASGSPKRKPLALVRDLLAAAARDGLCLLRTTYCVRLPCCHLPVLRGEFIGGMGAVKRGIMRGHTGGHETSEAQA